MSEKRRRKRSLEYKINREVLYQLQLENVMINECLEKDKRRIKRVGDYVR
ncbi:MAG: hypothetical protein QXX51_03020 [Candidatus Bathyarchaeia archaeon]